MEKKQPLVRLVSRRIPGTMRFGIKAILVDPETRERVKGRKTKKERRRIRKRYAAEKKPKIPKKPEAGRALTYAGAGRKR